MFKTSKLKNAIVLAPMENISDAAFRLTCKKFGADLVFSGMTHSKTIFKTKKIPFFCKEERPLAVQFVGNKVDELVFSAKTVEKFCDIIDLNLGCPSKKIINAGCGCALLNNLLLAKKIVKNLSSSVKTPVSVKMRCFTDLKKTIKTAKILETCGASLITIHPRTCNQGYSGTADWNVIREIKKNVKIPVIGNGDIKNGRDAKKILQICDAVMIGREAIGNPLIFNYIKKFLKKGVEVKPSVEEKIFAFKTYIKFAKKFDLFSKDKILFQSQNFVRGISGACKFRNSLSSLKNCESIVEKTIEFMNSKK